MNRDSIPGGLTGAWVQWRARRIADPVARLRYLRRSIGDQSWWTLAPHGRPRSWLRRHQRPLLLSAALLLLLPAGQWGLRVARLAERPPVLLAAPRNLPEPALPAVWLAEQQPAFETWSNGLRIERRFEVSHEPRQYRAYPLGRQSPSPSAPRTEPAGIVFHTTESHQADFAPGNVPRLTLIGEALLRYVQENRSYHYLIDRFGRVWRVVRESDSANHAGYSVWADHQHAYINLNRVFLGISLEAQSQPADGRPIATGAQIHALQLLAGMLRAKYNLAAANCVTHAQVSVNPSNFIIGYHTDWAARFPFAEIGLPDNYALPHPAIGLFGFTYESQLMQSASPSFWKGLLLGEEQFRQNATAHGLELARWRALRHQDYRAILKEIQQQTGAATPPVADHPSKP